MDEIKPNNQETKVPESAPEETAPDATAPEATDTSVAETPPQETAADTPATEASLEAESAPGSELAPETPASEPPTDMGPVTPPIDNTSEPKPAEPAAVDSHTPTADAAIKKPHGPMVAVMAIVILVILALGVVAYFAFVKKNTPKKLPSSASSQTNVVTRTSPDSATKSIDSSLTKFDETKDYSQTSLNDTTLGL